MNLAVGLSLKDGGLIDDLQFYIPFNSISAISGQWEVVQWNLFTFEKILPSSKD